MPFTFSHPAIILPLGKLPGKWVSLTGLIIGSLTPDFEYFLRTKIQSNYSHTIGGLFYFDLPIGILLSFIFHDIVRDSLYENLPIAFKSRVENFKTFDWNSYFKKHFIIVIISILIGAVSHLFWDSFTHTHGYFVRTYPVFQNHIMIRGYSIALYKILQHLSSLVGGLFVIATFYFLPKCPIENKNISATYWLIILIVFVSVMAVKIIVGIKENFLSQIVATSLSAFMLALIITPAFRSSFQKTNNTTLSQ